MAAGKISGITSIQLALPSRCLTAPPTSADFNQFNDRPDGHWNGNRWHQDNSNPDAAFDKTYFSSMTVTPNPGAWALPVASVLRPGLQNWNFCRGQGLPLGTERVRLRFRADFFNLFNHTNFANPVSNQSSGNFGKITATVGSAVATAVGTTAGVVGGGRA